MSSGGGSATASPQLKRRLVDTSSQPKFFLNLDRSKLALHLNKSVSCGNIQPDLVDSSTTISTFLEGITKNCELFLFKPISILKIIDLFSWPETIQPYSQLNKTVFNQAFTSS